MNALEAVRVEVSHLRCFLPCDDDDGRDDLLGRTQKIVTSSQIVTISDVLMQVHLSCIWSGRHSVWMPARLLASMGCWGSLNWGQLISANCTGNQLGAKPLEIVT